MMKFKFSLEPVLKIREHEETLQQQRLAKKMSEKRRLIEKRSELEKKLKGHLEDADRKEFESLHNLRRHRAHIQEVHQQMNRLNDSLRIVEKAVNKERNKLAKVHKKRHMLEKIKEEERVEFLEKISRQQQKVMDEIATQSFGK